LTVSDNNAEGLQAGDFVTIAGAGTISGVDVNGEYQIASVLSGTTYTVTLTTGTTGTNSAATITIAYQINVGQAIYSQLTGWGAGFWGGVTPSVLTTTLNGNLSASATSVVVALTTGFKSPSGLILVGNATAPGLKTSLPAAINNSVTTITVLSTYGYTATGVILIDTERITYTGVTATTFTGCTRGVSGTTAATHAAGAVVVQNALEDITYTGITATTTFTGATRGADGTTAAPFATGSLVFKADDFPGWGDSANTGGVGQQLRLWSQANFGELLIFAPRGGALYLWDPGTGTQPAYTTRGTLISGTDVPAFVSEVLISDATRIVICFGCNDYGAYGTTTLDPMLIRWSAQESYTNWTPSVANQAGSYRLSNGSTIIGALQTRQEILVWTDSAIYAMQYLGPPYVYGFTLLADNISIVSPNAMATANGVTYWMGADKFYVYSGRIETLPCAVRTYVYDDINVNQYAQIFAGTNEGFSEVWWFYCSAGSTVVDRYVIFNYLDRVWYYGTMGRTAWSDSPLRALPQAATTNNLLVSHESGADDGTTTPSTAIEAYVQSSDFDIGDGHNYGFVWQIIPDITFDGSTTAAPNFPQVMFTIRPRQNPGANYGTAGSPTVTSTQSYATEHYYNVQQFTEIVYTRARGRQMAFKVSSNTLGTQWQLGTPRLNVRPDGRR
jgi:hypothetical protein